jgi:hypothetical protein
MGMGSLFCSAGCVFRCYYWCVPDPLRRRWFSKETVSAKKKQKKKDTQAGTG